MHPEKEAIVDEGEALSVLCLLLLKIMQAHLKIGDMAMPRVGPKL
jgi:hypothetical protein